LVRIESGESIESVVGPGQVLDKAGLLARNDTSKVDPQVLDTLFKMPQPEAGKVVAREISMFTGDVMLVMLEKVVTPVTIEQSRIDSVKSQLKQDAASQDFSAALLSLRESADIYLNQRVLQK